MALHPLRATAPVTGRCTRYGALHPLRGAAPDQKGCHAYGSGALPPTTSTTADSSSRHTQAAASDAATQPRNTCPAPNKRRYTRSVALHPIRRATPDQKGCHAYGSGAHPITRTNAESVRRSPTRRQHAGGQLLMLQTPTAQVKTVAQGANLDGPNGERTGRPGRGCRGCSETGK